MGRMGDLMIDRMNSEREAAVEWLSKRHGYGKKGPHTYPATPEKPPFGPTPDLKVGRGALDEAKKKPKGKKPPMKATPDKEEDDLEVSSRSEDVPPRKKKAAMMKWLAKHQGPGPHKSGSSQDVHARKQIKTAALKAIQAKQRISADDLSHAVGFRLPAKNKMKRDKWNRPIKVLGNGATQESVLFELLKEMEAEGQIESETHASGGRIWGGPYYQVKRK